MKLVIQKIIQESDEVVADYEFKFNAINQFDSKCYEQFFPDLHRSVSNQLLNTISNEYKLLFARAEYEHYLRPKKLLPTWYFPKKNHIKESRTVVSDLLGLTSLIATLFKDCATPLCPIDGSPLVSMTYLELLQKLIPAGFSGQLCVIYKREDFEAYFPDEIPLRSWIDGQICDYKKTSEFVVATVIKQKNLISHGARLEQYLKRSGYLWCHLTGETKSFYIEGPELWVCEECYYCQRKNKTPHIFDPTSALGACLKCKGHGDILYYDKKKIIKKPNQKIKEACHVLLRSDFKSYLREFLLDVNAAGLTGEMSYLDNMNVVDQLLFEGGNSFEGLNSILTELEKYKYKKSIRIFLRSIQSESPCQSCHGGRASEELNMLKLAGCTINEILVKKIDKLDEWLLKVAHGAKGLDVVLKIKKAINLVSKMNCAHLNLNTKIRVLHPQDLQILHIIKFKLHEIGGSLLLIEEPFREKSEEMRDELRDLFNDVVDLENTIILTDKFKNLDTALLSLELSSSNNVFSVANNSGYHPINFYYDFQKMDPVRLNVFIKSNFYGFNEVKDMVTVGLEERGVTFRSTMATALKVYPIIKSTFGIKKNDESLCLFCEGKGHLEVDLLYLGQYKKSCKSCKGTGYGTSDLERVHEKTGLSLLDYLQLPIDSLRKLGINKLNDPLIDLFGLGHLSLAQRVNELSRPDRIKLKLMQLLKEPPHHSLIYLYNLTSDLGNETVAKFVYSLQRYLPRSNLILIYDHHLRCNGDSQHIVIK